MNEFEVRAKFVNVAKSWIGKKESDGSFKPIIDLYNKTKPLPRGYNVKYWDEWCATFVSACGIEAGMTDIIYRECSCFEMIKLYKAKGLWVENDAYVPKPGDIILYDWQDSGIGDNIGNPDHVGIVEKVDASTITIIEGNMNSSVGRRQIAVNGKSIRGYCTPSFVKLADGGAIYRTKLQKRSGLSDATMDYLENYKYGSELIRKLAMMK